MKTIKEINSKAIELVKAIFPNYEVEYTKCGNIKIINPLTCMCGNYFGHDCKKWYVIGKSFEGYWIRRVKYDLYWKTTNSAYPLRYNRNTGKYYFETFEEALIYLLKQKNNNKIDI